MRLARERYNLACVVAVAATLLGSLNAVHADPPQLQQFESKHYTIYTNLTREQAKKYGRHMDLVFAEYSKKFSAFRDRHHGRQNLYLFRTRRQYVDQLRQFDFDASASSGMFFYGQKAHGLATWVQGKSLERSAQILQHEGFHQFAFNYIGERLSLWVNEGLAEYFGDGLLIKGKMKLGIANERRIIAVRTAIQQQRAIGFDTLLNTSSKQWQANMLGGSPLGQLQYDQSWSIVYFLIHGDNGKYQRAFERYLMLLGEGRTSDKAFHTAFGTADTKAFQKRWEQFALNLEPDAYSTAIARLQFLGRGLKLLQQHAQPMPANIEVLRHKLQAVSFYTLETSHAGQIKTTAMDESNYQFQDKRGNTKRFELLEPSADNLPPRITAPGLDPQPTLNWSRDDRGQLAAKIEYR